MPDSQDETQSARRQLASESPNRRSDQPAERLHEEKHPSSVLASEQNQGGHDFQRDAASGQLLSAMRKWDEHFLRLAELTSRVSKDPSTKVGAVLVSPDRTDIILGYNGFPRKMPDLPEHYENREEKYSRIVHGEVNAVLLARRSVQGYTLYTWPCLSCERCAVLMIQAGIERVVAPYPAEDMRSRWGTSLDRSRQFFRECGVSVCEYGEGLIQP